MILILYLLNYRKGAPGKLKWEEDYPLFYNFSIFSSLNTTIVCKYELFIENIIIKTNLRFTHLFASFRRWYHRSKKKLMLQSWSLKSQYLQRVLIRFFGGVKSVTNVSSQNKLQLLYKKHWITIRMKDFHNSGVNILDYKWSAFIN